MNPPAGLLPLPLLHAAGWALIHFLWQGAIIAALLAVGNIALRHRPANQRYLAGCLAMGLMLLAPLLTFGRLYHPNAVPVNRSEQSAFPRALPEFGPAVRALPSPPRPTSHVNRVGPSIAVAQSAGLLPERLMPWLVYSWLAGVCGLSGRLCLGWFSVRCLRHNSMPLVEPSWAAKLDGLRKHLALRKPIALFQSALVEVPAVIGFVRPVILVPITLFTGLSPGQLEALLAHELAHIRRHDSVVNLVQNLVEVLLFYHPAVWWVSRRLREEREHCCDELAVQVCGDRLDYARALTALEELRGASPAWSLGAKGGTLFQRIRRILQQPEPARSQAGWWIVALVVVTVTLGAGVGKWTSAVAKEPESGGGKKSTVAPSGSSAQAPERAMSRTVVAPNGRWRVTYRPPEAQAYLRCRGLLGWSVLRTPTGPPMDSTAGSLCIFNAPASAGRTVWIQEEEPPSWRALAPYARPDEIPWAAEEELGDLSWSPDSGTLVVVKYEPGTGSMRPATIWKINVSEDAVVHHPNNLEGTRSLLFQGPSDTGKNFGWPAEQIRLGKWSADGRFLTFWMGPNSESLAADGIPLWMLETRTGKAWPLASAALINGRYQSWAPDSSALVFTAGNGREAQVHKWLDVFEVATGKTRTLVSADEQVPGIVEWSPAGDWIAYAAVPAAKTGPQFADQITFANPAIAGRRVYLLNPKTGQYHRLNQVESYQDAPTWEPAGRSLAYVELHGDHVNVLDADPDTGAARQVPGVQEPAPATVGYYGQAQWDDLLPWVVLLRSRQPAQRPSADQPPGGGSANRANPKGEPAAASPQAAEHAGTINPQIPPQSSAPGDLENSAFVRIAKAAPFLYLDNIPVTLEKLEAELRVRLARNPELRLSVGSDKDAPVKEFNKVKNVVRSVGITQFRAFSENRASGSEHAYRNKPPSAWLSELNITGGGDDQPAMEAIREMGTNAFPTLIQMLVKSSGDESLPSREQLKAMYVFGQLGPAARTAVPPLIDLLGSTHHQQIIIDTLVQIGVETVLPTLTAALTNQNPMVRIGMVKTLQEFPQRAETTVPLLVGLLKDDLPEVRAKAAQALGAVAKESEIAVPALIPLLTDGNEEIRLIAAASLGNYGTSAKAAKPDLLRLLQGTPFSTDLHGAARVALLQIDPDISFSRLQFRLVAKEGSNAVCDEYPDPLNPDNTLRVLKPVLLSEDSVASALFSRHLVSKEPEIKLALTDDGAAAFTRLTANNVHRQLAIIFDGKLLSAPIIHERISGGRISITGRLALAEAQTIMLILNRVNLDLSGRVTVTGEVNRPSLVVLPGTKIRVIDAINAAGGFTTFAIGPVLLTREGKIIGLKIREVRENTGRAKSLYLEPGDIIEALRSVL